MSKEKSRYAEAGVDIDRAGELLGAVKEKIKETKRKEVLAPVGGFGGLFELDLSRYENPVLVASVDGVGTKLMVANMMDKHDTVGFDIVNHCVNDIIVQGAEPLYFMDYLGIGKLKSPLYENVLTGLAEACKELGISLLGGETAEMPGLYGEEYDLVGCIQGIVDKKRMITGAEIKPGHVAIGLASNGLHTNGYSLARKVLFEEAGFKVDDKPAELEGLSVGEALLKPHVCYWRAVKEALIQELPLHGLAHITGGGFYDNVPRILPEGVDVHFEKDVLARPPIFDLIKEKGQVSEKEMYKVFNMGIGMMWFVPESAADSAITLICESGFPADRIGTVVDGNGVVKIKGIDFD